MEKITKCLLKKDISCKPVWFMRQAGRYLPEFRKIRKSNPDFIKLCLNSELSSEITLQPIKRFGFDGAVIFSDILMLPYGLGQNVEFKKNFGPRLGEFIFQRGKKKALDLATKKAVDTVRRIEQERVAREAARRAETQRIQARINRDPRGYDGSRGPSANPYGGGGGGLHSDYKADGGLITMFVERR